MIRSLNLLAVENENDLKNPQRIHRLFWNKNLSEINFALPFFIFGFISLIIVGKLFLSTLNKNTLPGQQLPLWGDFLFLLFPVVFLGIGLYAARKILNDPLLLFLQNPQRFEFAAAQISNAIYKYQEKGRSKYLVYGNFSLGENREFPVAETFSARIWKFKLPDFDKEFFENKNTEISAATIPAFVIYDRENPKNVAIIGIPKKEINRIPKKDREDGGDLLVTVMMILFFLIAAFFFSLIYWV